MGKYKLELSEFGKKVYKGGNIPVMKKWLKTYSSEKEIEKKFLEMGSGNRSLFVVKKVI